MKKAYLDEHGFFAGEIDDAYISPSFSQQLVDAAAPPEDPPSFFAWRWGGGGTWELATDNRRRLWYKEDDTDVEYVGATPDDAPPAGYVEFVNGVGKMAGLPEQLRKAKDAKWEQMKQARAAEIASALVTPYGTFDADADSRKAISDSVLLLQTMSKRGPPPSISFTLANNASVSLTLNQMEDVGLLLGEKTNLAFEKGRTLRAQIEAATTVEQVVAIQW